MEIIIADGMSTDGTREVLAKMAQKDQRIQVLDNPGMFVSTGLNQAIERARGEVIVRIDAHTTYSPDYIINCIAALQSTGADNVGGPWVARGEGTVSSAIAAAFQSRFSAGGARGHDPAFSGPVDTVYLGCWPKETFTRFGLFDPELVRNQDDEHNLRIIRGGGRVYQSSKIKSWYKPRNSLSALFRQYTQYGYWKVRVIQKHKIPASWRHVVPGAFLLTVLGLLLLFLATFSLSVLDGDLQITRALAKWSAGLLILALGTYVLAVLAASVETAAKNSWTLLPLLTAVFPCYHIGYGYGFLRGLWDFSLKRTRSVQAAVALTR